MLSHSSKYLAKNARSHSDDSSSRDELVSSSRRSKKKKSSSKYSKRKAKKLHRKHKSRKSSSEESDSSDSSSDDSDSESSESSSSSSEESEEEYSESELKKSKKKKSKMFAKQKKLERAKKKMLEEYEKRILDELSVNAVTEYMKIKVDTFLKKRQFFNGPAESTELTDADLKQIIVTIERHLPANVDPMEISSKVKCEFETLDDLTVPRVPDEGQKGIFDREDIKNSYAEAAIQRENREKIIPRFLLKPSKVRIKRRHATESPLSGEESPSGQHAMKRRYLEVESVQKKFKKRLTRGTDSESSEHSPLRSDLEYSGGSYIENRLPESDREYFSDHSNYNTEPEEYRSNSALSSNGSIYEEEDDYENHIDTRFYNRRNNTFRQRGGRPMRFQNRGNRPQRFWGRGGFPRPMLTRAGMQRPFMRNRRPMGRFRPPYRARGFMGPPNMHRNFNHRFNHDGNSSNNEFGSND